MKQALDTGQYFGNLLSKRKLTSVILSETKYTPHSTVPNHCHKNFYICYVLNGCYSEAYLKKKINCLKGDIIIHPQHMEHSNLFNENGGTCFNVELTDVFQNKLHELKLNNCRMFDNTAAHLPTVIEKIYKEYKAYDEFSDTIIEGLLLEAIGYSAREISKNSSPYWFNKAKAMIVVSNSARVSLSSIAADLNISASHLSRSFKKATGLTIGEYIRDVKIQKACEKLKDINADILDVSLEFGFSDQSHFTKTFKKIMSITPKQYRATNKQNYTKISKSY